MFLQVLFFSGSQAKADNSKFNFPETLTPSMMTYSKGVKENIRGVTSTVQYGNVYGYESE